MAAARCNNTCPSACSIEMHMLHTYICIDACKCMPIYYMNLRYVYIGPMSLYVHACMHI